MENMARSMVVQIILTVYSRRNNKEKPVWPSRIPNSHGARLKRVLIGNDYTDSKITQIAVTDLN